MERRAGPGQTNTAEGNHYPCSMSAVMIAEVNEFGGPEAVAELLRRSGTERSVEYLTDLSNWTSYDEAVGLWRAAMEVTHNPSLPRLLGQRAAERLAASPVLAMLRSLGSPGAVYRQIATSASKFSAVVQMEALEVDEQTAVLSCEPIDGFPRAAEHCAWTIGLLSTAPILFGLDHATVEHDQCAALGADKCIYRITWAETSREGGGAELEGLRGQLEGLEQRFNSLFAAASDLIAADDIDDILAPPDSRAALEVRAPRHLLAVRMQSGGKPHVHHRGFGEDELTEHTERLLDPSQTDFPGSWLVVPVRSDRRDYGRLVAAFQSERSFFEQERGVLEIFARYAASALDNAAALSEAHALLRLARALASAGTSTEVAQRLAEAVPLVVDADRVSVFLWDRGREKIVKTAATSNDPHDPLPAEEFSRTPTRGGNLERLIDNPQQDPIFLDAESGPPDMREAMLAAGNVAAIVVPIVTVDTFLGMLSVSVRDRPERLAPSPDLLNRLSGVTAQATTALQNGRLVDQITHQATHDQLTGLANRADFTRALRHAIAKSRRNHKLVTVLYIDLDRFKPVNDEFGHDTGDRLLGAVARRLKASTRTGDLVARLGGDEFAVLMTGHDSPDEATKLFERLRAAFVDPFTVRGHKLRVSPSIGRAAFPADADSADALLRKADMAMFEDKRKRNSRHGATGAHR